jgi:tripartite-type tricarboxylate transporter receptor subunit TctC
MLAHTQNQEKTMRLSVVCARLMAAAMACAAIGGWAQPYPTKPIRIISPSAPGGTTDVLARIIATEMTKTISQPVIVEYKTGAGGIVGTNAIAQAPADGYTIGLINSAHAVHPGMNTKLPYDSASDFTAISLLCRVPNVLSVHPSLPARDLKEFLALVRANPGKYSFASPGTGTAAHLAGELLKLRGNVDIQHVPYRGGAPAVQDLMAGQILLGFNNVNTILPFIRSGRVRPISVTSTTRSPVLPDVAAMVEQVPDYENAEWYGMVGPKGMSKEIVAKLQAEIHRILNEPAGKAKYLNELGVELIGSAAEDFDAFLRAELQRWPPLVKQFGIKGE